MTAKMGAPAGFLARCSRIGPESAYPFNPLNYFPVLVRGIEEQMHVSNGGKGRALCTQIDI